MTIADLSLDGADDAVALWRTCGLTRPWNDPHADLVRALEGSTSTVLGSLHDGRLVGTVMTGHDGHRGWVYYLAVHPDVRRRGLGRGLMQAGEQWLRERGVPKLNLMVRTDNAAVVHFYNSLGNEDGKVLVLGKFLDG